MPNGEYGVHRLHVWPLVGRSMEACCRRAAESLLRKGVFGRRLSSGVSSRRSCCGGGGGGASARQRVLLLCTESNDRGSRWSDDERADELGRHADDGGEC